MKRLILWDIDKTLVRHFASRDLFHVATEQLLGEAIDRPPITKDGKSDGQIAREFLNAAGADDRLDEYMRILDDVSREALITGASVIIPVEGVVELLHDLGEAGFANGLYTGNTKARAFMKLASARIPVDGLFNQDALFCQGARPGRFHEAKRVRASFPDAQITVVGDTAYDYHLAELIDADFWQVGSADFPQDARIALGRSAAFAAADASAFKRSLGL